jgi:actin-related protein 3
MFQSFSKRLQRDVKVITDVRTEEARSKLKGTSELTNVAEVKVIQHSMQRFAVWFGGSMLASMVSCLRIITFNLF